MEEKLQKSIDSLENWINSDAGELFIQGFELRQEIRKNRWTRFEEWLKNNDFDKLMYRLFYEHNEDYRDKCYNNGCEPFPNQKLDFILDYVTEHCEPVIVDKISSTFTNNIYLFRDYYFQFIHGQGTIIRIYNRDDCRLLLQV